MPKHFTIYLLTAIAVLISPFTGLQAGTYEGPFVVRILDAQNKMPVEGAAITFSGAGGKTVTGFSDARGWVQIADFPFTEEDDAKGDITFSVSADGFGLLEDRSPVYQKRLMLSRKNLTPESYRIVLSWGHVPDDLDSHLFFNGKHIYWNAQDGTNNARQDVDHRERFGPETITIGQVKKGTRYRYVVQDYSNRYRNDHWLSASDARVQLYGGEDSGLIKTFYVPPNRKGNIWYVFEITKRGKIKEINKLGYIDYKSW